jgi:exopolysaccharide biosynthesis polyprenyl glycosylphosphotransferase
VLIRVIARVIARHYGEASHHGRKVLIVGANARSLDLAKVIRSRKSLGFEVLGFVDTTSEHAPGLEAAGFTRVAALSEFRDYLAKTVVDEVLICLPTKSQFDEVARVLEACEEQGVMVGVLRDLFPGRLDYSRVLQFSDHTIISVYPHGIYGGRAAIKRSFDLFVSLLLLAALSPVFLAIALLIKLGDPGPIFFSQERVGLNKKRFRMLKFRTMVPNAEARQRELEAMNEAQGPAFKIKHDPRVTRLGRILRRLSLDELPQLINVVRGEMSLVGPRPLPVRDYEGFSEDWHRRRLSVRPGMTGLWQVYSRDHQAFDEWMKLDLEYIDRWSLLLDVKVMLFTLPAMLRGSGA